MLTLMYLRSFMLETLLIFIGILILRLVFVFLKCKEKKQSLYSKEIYFIEILKKLL